MSVISHRIVNGMKTAPGLLAALCLQACLLQLEKTPLVLPDAESDVGTDEISDEVPVAAIEEFCFAAFDVLCGFFNTCCTSDERSNAYIFDLVIAVGFDCLSPAASVYYRDCVLGATQSASEGRMAVNESSVPACTNALATFSPACQNAGVFLMNFFVVMENQCSYVWEGLAAENEFCRFQEECADGLYCDVSDQCLPEKGDGGACSSDDECGEEMACLPGGFCGAPRGVGQGCEDDEDCSLLLFCNLQTGFCAALLEAGASCIEGSAGCRGLCRDGVCVDACG